MTSHLTHHEALIYVMVMTSAVDRIMSDEELARIGRLTNFLPVFADFDEDRLVDTARECANLVAGPEGLDITLEIVREALPTRLYDTAYALAVEIATADLRVKPEEIRLLQLLRDRLKLDKLTCAAIERSAMARFRE
ncbi:tellurite resistance TerB family protein [Pararhizobium sp.]|uniref:tellurite resistance TerB family protein n=1 Tax=Pararhizobium sp. TaxID=1977563 RepID=UPI0027231E24|nr:tellurite resistance TerB family protein [Pararhizobium sp.]MDO9416319.1 tellurite resistance TerB family protein [Pararhizobium sp.]